MNPTMQGECNCGAVRFELLTAIQSMYKCFCTLCQKQSGTASNAATLVLAKDFHWTAGRDEITVWKKNTGFNSHFCKYCGSPVPNTIGQKYLWIPIGLMGSIDAKVVVTLFENTKPQWEEACVNQSLSLGGVRNVDDLFERLCGHSLT